MVSASYSSAFLITNSFDNYYYCFVFISIFKIKLLNKFKIKNLNLQINLFEKVQSIFF